MSELAHRYCGFESKVVLRASRAGGVCCRWKRVNVRAGGYGHGCAGVGVGVGAGAGSGASVLSMDLSLLLGWRWVGREGVRQV